MVRMACCIVVAASCVIASSGLERHVALAQTESLTEEGAQSPSKEEIRLRAEQFVDDLISDYGRRRAAAEPARRSGRVTFNLPLKAKARAGIVYNGKFLHPGMKIQDIEAVLGVADEQVLSRRVCCGRLPRDMVIVSYLFYSKGLTVTMPPIWLESTVDNTNEYFNKAEQFSFEFYNSSKDTGGALRTRIGDPCRGKLTHAKLISDIGMALDETTDGSAMDKLLLLRNLRGSIQEGSHGSVDFSSYYGGSIKFVRFRRDIRDSEYLKNVIIYDR